MQGAVQGWPSKNQITQPYGPLRVQCRQHSTAERHLQNLQHPQEHLVWIMPPLSHRGCQIQKTNPIPILFLLFPCMPHRHSGQNFCFSPHPLGRCPGTELTDKPLLCAQVSSSLAQMLDCWGRPCQQACFRILFKHTLLQTLCSKCSFLRPIDFINNRAKERNTSRKDTSPITSP